MRNIGKYEVVEKIGEGGFGTIFKGFDPHIRRFVAIKSCSSEEQEVRNRFFHEAQIAGNLQHRHIVTVYDFGLQDGVPYLVQEYLSGEDLDRKIKRKDDIPLAEKLLYLIQVARGLEYAHSKGVVHRDIKPANVRILEDGTAKIMDFGIAKLTNQDTGLTQTGMTLGTAAYLAPEQIRGETIGPATDMFSWGVTAWELLSYSRPFSGQHISTVLYQILNEPQPPLRDAAPGVPAEVVAVVDRCLEKKPERRYPTCTELLRDLDRAIQARRAAALGGMGALAADSRAEIAETRAFAAAAARKPADGARTATIATGGTGLGDLDLEGTGVDPRRTPHSISSTQAMKSRGFPWGTWVGAVAGVLVLAALGWWLVQRGRQPAKPQAEVATNARGESGGISVSAEPRATLAPPAPTPTPLPTAAPTPTPTATPRPSYLVVPAAWSRDVWVTVGKQRRRLDHEQRFAVSPGSNTKVSFEYSGAYSDRAQSSVRVDEGETTRLAVPLERGGLIQVQQKVGTPMGRVVLDGADLGNPIVRKPAKPGSHQLRIEPSGAGAAAIDQQVELRAGTRLVLTFDLASGKVTQVVGELPAP
ncbi:MAG TPA: serine/threonine-protein kinase [Thermoanaerobaculia bacterium]|jgi:serine/threonine-protein kinase|nr:serine/threonine-protein kinase [Thermoanaerobaculia bacterium]